MESHVCVVIVKLIIHVWKEMFPLPLSLSFTSYFSPFSSRLNAIPPTYTDNTITATRMT